MDHFHHVHHFPWQILRCAPLCPTFSRWPPAATHSWRGKSLNLAWLWTIHGQPPDVCVFWGCKWLMEDKLNTLSIDFPSFKQQRHPFELSAICCLCSDLLATWQAKKPSPEDTVMFYMWSTYGPHMVHMLQWWSNTEKPYSENRQIVESKRITNISSVRNQVLQFYNQSCTKAALAIS